MFEYDIVPAPKKGKKAKGVKTAEARFANALSELINEKAAEGWEYLRTDTLPSEERSGLRSRTTVFQNMLVFRRALEAEAEVEAPVAKPDVAEIAALHAPKLPSAMDAQDAPAPAPKADAEPQGERVEAAE